MNGNVTQWNEVTRGLVRSNPGELRLMDLENILRMIDHLALTRDGIHFNTQQGRRWINDVFPMQLREVEQELKATNSLGWTSSTGGGRVGAACRNHSPIASGLWQWKREQLLPLLRAQM